jgi:hypothetical protein
MEVLYVILFTIAATNLLMNMYLLILNILKKEYDLTPQSVQISISVLFMLFCVTYLI